MNTLYYFQPQDDDTLLEEYSSYSVWLDKETCKDLFPDTEILILKEGDIELPSFIENLERKPLALAGG